MQSNKLFIGILAGFAGGVLAGILFSPEKGEDLRQNIKHNSEDYAGSIKDKFNELIDVISEKYQNTNNSAEAWAEEEKDKFNEMMVESKEKKQEIKSKATGVVT
jgi:gas vesicle protein